MNILLLFFALPIAVIIVSIALQKILRNPFLVAGIIFSIFLVFTFTIGDLNFLVATIVYTIISVITAIAIQIICRILRNYNSDECRMSYGNSMENDNKNDVTVIDNNGTREENIETNETFNNGVSAKINVIPNSYNSGNICGNYKRR